MGRLVSIVVSAVMMVVGSAAVGQSPVSIGGQGWTITASPDQGLLDISQTTLGVILKDIRIAVQSEGGPTNWRSEAARKTISVVDKLGLDSGSGYIVFDS
jgi:hypothetical protein